MSFFSHSIDAKGVGATRTRCGTHCVRCGRESSERIQRFSDTHGWFLWLGFPLSSKGLIMTLALNGVILFRKEILFTLVGLFSLFGKKIVSLLLVWYSSVVFSLLVLHQSNPFTEIFTCSRVAFLSRNPF